jgi:hypothetical protein
MYCGIGIGDNESVIQRFPAKMTMAGHSSSGQVRGEE